MFSLNAICPIEGSSFYRDSLSLNGEKNCPYQRSRNKDNETNVLMYDMPRSVNIANHRCASMLRFSNFISLIKYHSPACEVVEPQMALRVCPFLLLLPSLSTVALLCAMSSASSEIQTRANPRTTLRVDRGNRTRRGASVPWNGNTLPVPCTQRTNKGNRQETRVHIIVHLAL